MGSHSGEVAVSPDTQSGLRMHVQGPVHAFMIGRRIFERVRLLGGFVKVRSVVARGRVSGRRVRHV